ncbi:MAG: hypothetical protein KC592_07470 [Nitrospira sp.]|nr:hypothetical protein [Nitrospira sp.]HBP88355.1 hypothetical protein [Nitrospiraceae bacterium]HNP29770.1 hypothetical protein [Nitrospirales bacterium]
MALKKGDIIDERKRYPDSCGLVLKVMSGGEGFEKIRCCGHDLTLEDVVPSFNQERGRRAGALAIGMPLDEKIVATDSCGLRLMVMAGGAGFQEVICCGHSFGSGAIQSLEFGQMRSEEDPNPNTPHQGTA